MSDQARQSYTDKAASALKPDSQKSTTEHVGDKIKGAADDVASKVQPESEKSTSQKAGDALSVDNGGDNTPLIDKAKNAILGDRNSK